MSSTYVTILHTGMGIMVFFENNRDSEISGPGTWRTTFLEKYNFSCTNFKKIFPPKNTTFDVLTLVLVYVIVGLFNLEFL